MSWSERTSSLQTLYDLSLLTKPCFSVTQEAPTKTTLFSPFFLTLWQYVRIEQKVALCSESLLSPGDMTDHMVFLICCAKPLFPWLSLTESPIYWLMIMHLLFYLSSLDCKHHKNIMKRKMISIFYFVSLVFHGRNGV